MAGEFCPFNPVKLKCDQCVTRRRETRCPGDYPPPTEHAKSRGKGLISSTIDPDVQLAREIAYAAENGNRLPPCD